MQGLIELDTDHHDWLALSSVVEVEGAGPGITGLLTRLGRSDVVTHLFREAAHSGLREIVL